jgi:hypothetical protein
VTARTDPFKVHVAGQVLAALAEAAPLPLSTPAVEDRTGYGRRHGQLVYTVLTQLARAGQVEKLSAPGVKPVYWRRLTPLVSLPPMTARCAMTTLPYPHARNDCQFCRERDADFEVTVDDPVTGPRTSLLCQKCLGPWSVTQVYLLDGCAAMTVEWAPGRRADHGLTGGGR